MSMTLPVDAAASRLGGALDFMGTMTPQMPDFGAMPDAVAVESANAAQAERARESQARQEAAQRRYRELVESGTIDENGLSKDGKMFRGPQARLFVAQNGGRDFVLKDKDLAAQLNRITIAENRELGGLDPLPEESVHPAAQYGEVPEQLQGQGISQDRWNRFNRVIDGTEKPATPEEYKTAQQIVMPSFSEREQKRTALEEKKRKAEAAQKKNIEVIQDGAESAIRMIDRALENLSDGVLPESGLSGAALSYVPGTDAYTLFNDIEALKDMIGLGGLLDMKQASANGASGFGSLSERELQGLQRRISRLDAKERKDVILDDLRFIRSRFEKALNPQEIRDSDLEFPPASAPATGQTSTPKRFKFTSDGSLVGG